ncbi:MAG: L-lactate permease, partial [Pseudomonadota bacterium]
ISGLIAAINCLIGFGLLWVLMRLADDGPMTRRDLGIGALAGVCFVVPFLLLASFTGPELPALAGAMIGLAIFLVSLRKMGAIGKVALRPLIPDLVPYLLLVGLILITRLIPSIKQSLNEIAIAWELMSVFSGSFAPLYHPGTLMMLSIVLAALLFKRSQFVLPAAGAAMMRLLPVGLALMLMLALSRTMVHTGMIETLAQSAALTGSAWPLFAPLVGTLGTFVSGSATTSNILFTEFQVSTANLIDLAPVTMIAAQGVGAAIGNIIAPHNIIAGCATVGLAGKEGIIMRTTVPAALVCLAFCGVVALAMV